MKDMAFIPDLTQCGMMTYLKQLLLGLRKISRKGILTRITCRSKRTAAGRDRMAYERKEIDRKEVLTLLGKMYALTATGKGRIGLCRYIKKEAGPTITGKYTFMARAMLRIRLITHVDGKGVATLYRWNLKQYGPPSIPLADMIIAETAEQIRIAAKKRYYAKKERDGTN